MQSKCIVLNPSNDIWAKYDWSKTFLSCSVAFLGYHNASPMSKGPSSKKTKPNPLLSEPVPGISSSIWLTLMPSPTFGIFAIFGFHGLDFKHQSNLFRGLDFKHGGLSPATASLFVWTLVCSSGCMLSDLLLLLRWGIFTEISLILQFHRMLLKCYNK